MPQAVQICSLDPGELSEYARCRGSTKLGESQGLHASDSAHEAAWSLRAEQDHARDQEEGV